jgi:hypothetical protein
MYLTTNLLNPAHGRICLTHGLLVEILRRSYKFWVAYKQVLELNGKTESDVKDLHHIMKKMNLAPKSRGKITIKKKNKVRDKVTEDFNEGLNELDTMMKSIVRIIYNDETFMYRATREIKKLYLKFRKNQHLPEHMHHLVEPKFYELLLSIKHFQRHTWIAAKGHARYRMGVRDISMFSSRSKRRHIRQSTIELDHIRNNIDPLKEKLNHLSRYRTHEELHRLNQEIHKMLHLYREEIHDVETIMKESEILLRRTDEMFKEMEKEIKKLGFKKLKKKVNNYAKKYRKLLQDIEKHSRREFLAINKIVNALPAPRRHTKAAAAA